MRSLRPGQCLPPLASLTLAVPPPSLQLVALVATLTRAVHPARTPRHVGAGNPFVPPAHVLPAPSRGPVRRLLRRPAPRPLCGPLQAS